MHRIFIGIAMCVALFFCNFAQAIDTVQNRHSFVTTLLENGGDVNQTYLKQTPLSLMIHDGNVDLIRALLKKGAQTNHVNAYGRTPLIEAMSHRNSRLNICHCRPEIVRLLIQYGADPSASANHKKDMVSLLGHAAKLEEKEAAIIIGLLLNHDAHIRYVDRRKRWSPLFQEGAKKPAILKALQQHGLDMKQKNSRGETVSTLYKKNNIEVSSILANNIFTAIEERQYAHIAKFRDSLESINKQGMTPVIYAASRNDTKAVEAIAELSGGMDKIVKQHGERLLQLAALHGSTDTVTELINQGISIYRQGDDKGSIILTALTFMPMVTRKYVNIQVNNGKGFQSQNDYNDYAKRKIATVLAILDHGAHYRPYGCKTYNKENNQIMIEHYSEFDIFKRDVRQWTKEYNSASLTSAIETMITASETNPRASCP